MALLLLRAIKHFFSNLFDRKTKWKLQQSCASDHQLVKGHVGAMIKSTEACKLQLRKCLPFRNYIFLGYTVFKNLLAKYLLCNPSFWPVPWLNVTGPYCINRPSRSLASDRLIINCWCFLRKSFAQWQEMNTNTINFMQKTAFRSVWSINNCTAFRQFRPLLADRSH